MATVTITGRVGKPLTTYGFEVWELITLPTNQSYEKKWAVWGPKNLVTDSIVIVTGTGSWKVREYQDLEGNTKQAIDSSINDPEVKTITSTEAPF